MQKIQTGKGYAWLIEGGLCHWVAPDKHTLEREVKPSPEAKIVAVRIVREKDFRTLSKGK